MTTSPTTQAASLYRVREAAEVRELAAEQYRRALLEARAQGHSVVEIADAAGVSREAVYQQLRRNGR